MVPVEQIERPETLHIFMGIYMSALNMTDTIMIFFYVNYDKKYLWCM